MSAGATLEKKSNNEQSERYIVTRNPGENCGSINNYTKVKYHPDETKKKRAVEERESAEKR